MPKRPLTGLHYGDPVLIVAPTMDTEVDATYVGYAGGSTAMVKLAITGALIQVPRVWIERPPAERKETA